MKELYQEENDKTIWLKKNRLNDVSKYYLLMDYYLLSFMFIGYGNDNRYSLIIRELNRRYGMIPCKCIQCDIDIKDSDKAFCEKCLKLGPKDKIKKLIRKGEING